MPIIKWCSIPPAETGKRDFVKIKKDRKIKFKPTMRNICEIQLLK